jgi:hypothetical protein
LSTNRQRLSPPRVPAPLPSIEQRVGQVSSQEEIAASSARNDTNNLLKHVNDAIARYERAPKWNSIREAERLTYFVQLLERTILLGKTAIEDKAALEKSVERWRAVSKTAGPVFREAEASFRKRLNEAQFEEQKKLFLNAAEYYAARAVRAEFIAREAMPEDVSVQIKRIEAMTDALDILHGYVIQDPYYLQKNNEADMNVVAFNEAFAGINDVLRAWTAKLLEGMEKVNAVPKKVEPAQAKRPAV